MSIVIARETLTLELAPQVVELARKCWAESTEFKGESCAYHGLRDYKIEPDVEAYMHFQAHGMLAFVTLRDGGVLFGYVIGFTYPVLHHKGMVGSIGDSIYIEPEYRKHTWAVAKCFEETLTSMGAQIIGWPVHINGPVYEILAAKGYVGDDIVMEKRLCASPPQ